MLDLKRGIFAVLTRRAGGGRIGRMNTRIAVLPLFLAVCCAAGRAQTVTPSITFGTHVLKLGMQETVVLEQLGSDFNLRAIRGSAGTTWTVSEHPGSEFKYMGSLFFDSSHHLAFAMRYWEIDDTSSSSFFYALESASKSLEGNGLTNCRVSTTEKDSSVVGGGNIHVKEILFDCGPEQVSIDQNLSKSADIISGIGVTERLRGK